MTNDLYLCDINQYPVFLIFLKPFDTTNDHAATVINMEDMKYNEHNCYESMKRFGWELHLDRIQWWICTGTSVIPHQQGLRLLL